MDSPATSKRGGNPIGWVFVAGGLSFIVFLGQTSTLMCDRVESNRIDCQLTSAFLGIVLSETEIRQVQSAEVEVINPITWDDTYTYRVTLVSNRGNVPLTSWYTSGRHDKERMADRINAFIASPIQPSLEIRTSAWLAYVIGVIFILVGLYIAGIIVLVRDD